MTLNSIFMLAIIFLVFIIIILGAVYYSMLLKEKENDNSSKKKKKEDKPSNELTSKSYSKQSIFDFMEFDKIEDNMIIQKGGKRFLMVIECQGINYDLMSEIEQTSVESGFIQFLNTLRNPIQIYVQTRTINLEDSLKKYKEKLKKIESDLVTKENTYKSMVEAGNYNQKQINKKIMDIKRQTNLFNYARDVIANTERMTLNKNVLRKKYYIILSYYHADSEEELLSDYEIREVAFSDLYTKCQSTIRALAASGVNGSVLDSYQLVDLMYNAYNRDEAENYGIDRAIRAGYDDLYITSRDILQKKMNAINNEIEQKALDLAEDSIRYADEELQNQVEEKEENFDSLIMELAEQLIDENQEYFTDDLIKQAKKEVKKAGKKISKK